jgi:hypothetical protein
MNVLSKINATLTEFFSYNTFYSPPSGFSGTSIAILSRIYHLAIYPSIDIALIDVIMIIVVCA